MKFENKGKWFGESAKRFKEEDLTNDEMLALDEEDDFSDLVADDELDIVDDDEQPMNEVRYIDPENLDKYDPDEIEEVTDAQGNKRYKRSDNIGARQQEPKPAEGNDLKSFADNYGNNEAKKITELQDNIAALARKEKRSGKPGFHRDEINALRNQQKEMLKPLAKQLSTATKSDAANIVKDIMDKAGVAEKDKNNFGYMLAGVPIDDSGKTLADAFGMKAYQFGDMVGKFYK